MPLSVTTKSQSSIIYLMRSLGNEGSTGTYAAPDFNAARMVAIISTEWKSGRGHVFNLLNVDGEVWLLDAAANRAKPITKSSYLKEKTKSAILYRSDDGSVDKEMVAATFGEEGRVRFTLAQGNRRIRSPSTGSVLAYLRLMCHSKGDIFEVYQYKEDSKKAKDGYEQIGRIRSTGIDATYGEGVYEIVVWNYEWI